MKILITIFAIISLSSCFFPTNPKTKYELFVDCNLPVSEVIRNMSDLVKKEKMEIQYSSIEEGVLVAEIVGHTSKIWSFKVQDNKISASAFKKTDDSDPYSNFYSITYCNDNTDQDEKWYWNVRNGLQNACKNGSRQNQNIPQYQEIPQFQNIPE